MKDRQGQSLIEVLIAMVVGTIMILAAITIIVPALKSNTDVAKTQVAIALGRELLDNAKVFGEASWPNIAALSTSSANTYFLNASRSPFVAVKGTESVVGAGERGLVGHWKLDEATGTVAYDFSGAGAQGTMTGAPTITASCQVGGCLSFDGTDDYVNIPNMAQTSSSSVSLWFKQTASKTALLFGSTNPADSSGEFALIVNSGGRTEFYRWITAGGDRPHLRATAPDNALISYGAWHHLVGVYDGVTAYLYLNGMPVANSSTTQFSSSWQGGIGAGSGGFYWFNGEIDDVRVYDRALSASEAGDLYRAQTYARHFYLDDVKRDGSGAIVTSGGTTDPSTKKVTVVYGWPKGPTQSVATYLTRSRNNIFSQTDWSGGGGQSGPATSVGNAFATSSNISFTSTTGSIIINL